MFGFFPFPEPPGESILLAAGSITGSPPWMEECARRVIADMEAGRISTDEAHRLMNVLTVQAYTPGGRCPTWNVEPDGSWIYDRRARRDTPQARARWAGPHPGPTALPGRPPGPHPLPNGPPPGSIPQVPSQAAISECFARIEAAYNAGDISITQYRYLIARTIRASQTPGGKCPLLPPPASGLLPTIAPQPWQQCFDECLAMWRSGEITEAQFREWVRQWEAAQRWPGARMNPGSGVCPPLPVPSQTRRIVRGGASRISSTASRCRRWVTGNPIVRGATYTVIGGVIYECLARELPSSEECDDQRAFYINGFHDLYECFKGLLDQFLAIRLKMLNVRNFCPVTPACRRRLDDAMARLNSAAETVRGWMEEANNARNAVFNIQCDIFDPTLITGSIHALALQAAEQRHERLTELCNEGARTLAGWQAEATKLSKECGCKAAGVFTKVNDFDQNDDKNFGGGPNNG